MSSEKKHSDPKAHAQHQIESAAEHHEHHLVEAPKGTSRARFMFNFLLVVFLLLIFSITGPMMDALSGGSGGSGETYVKWTTPEGKTVDLDYNEFITEKRKFGQLADFFSYLRLPNLDPGEDIQLARFLILEQMALRSGVRVADKEVGATLIQLFGDQANYNNYIAGHRDWQTKSFEQIFRRGLVVRRFLMFSGMPAAEVLPEKVIERWQLSAKEYNFEFVEVLTADFEEAARAELPDDAGLEDWFNGLGQYQKAQFNTESSSAADLAWIDPSAEHNFDILFERYPRPLDEDREVMAQNYYNSNVHIRFVRPVPAKDESVPADEGGTTEGENPEEPKDEPVVEKYYSMEEVGDQVRREAPIYYSLMDWLSHMQKRVRESEEVDFETEATELGLTFERVPPRTTTAFREGEEAWTGDYFAGAVVRLKEGEFTRRIVVEKGAFAAARVVEVLPPSLPPFAEIRDAVADKWVAERSPKIAVEKLEAVRDSFGERPAEGEFVTSATDEAFKTAVEAAGFEVQERGWKTQFPRPGDPEARPTQADFFLQSKTFLFSQEAGYVSAAEASRDGKAAYLVRFMGEREGDLSTMRPIEADQTLMQLRSSTQMKYFADTYGNDDWLRSHFGLSIRNELEGDEG